MLFTRMCISNPPFLKNSFKASFYIRVHMVTILTCPYPVRLNKLHSPDLWKSQKCQLAFKGEEMLAIIEVIDDIGRFLSGEQIQ